MGQFWVNSPSDHTLFRLPLSVQLLNRQDGKFRRVQCVAMTFSAIRGGERFS